MIARALAVPFFRTLVSGRLTLPRFFAVLTIASVTLSACGGGGGGGAVPSTATPTPAPTSTVSSQSQTVTLSASAGAQATYSITNYSATVGFPAATVATSLATTFSSTAPSGSPAISSLARRPQNIGQSPLATLVYLSVTATASTILTKAPTVQLTVPSSAVAAASQTYLAFDDPAQSSGWTVVAGPPTVSGTTFSFTSNQTNLTLAAGQVYYLAVFTLATAVATPTPQPSATATNPAQAAEAFTCPTSDTPTSVVARAGISGAGSESVRRSSGLRTAHGGSSIPGLLAVTYSASALSSSSASALASSRELATGANLVRSFSFTRTGKVLHVLSVPPAQMSSIEATLRAQPGVESVAPTGAKRFSTTVSSPYFTNDPYFNGFTATQNEAAQNLNLNTYHVGPYEESSNVPGQWDMHAIGLENAFAYSQSNNGSTVMKPLAIGSLSIKIAIIDTGEDSTHPELASKVAYQKCFITNPSGVASTSNFETDELGHGTDVSGIAAATTNNTFGFAGAGGNSVIYGYRVFPTPDDNCTNDTTNDNQCGSDTVDIASAIDDAVARGVNVISMSLGGNTCGTGSGFAANGDSDPTEGAAVAEAIAHNIVVVAAAGNSGGTGVASPGCDTGVIAVGATSLADGSANGSSVPGGSPTAPIEYVTSYTQTGSPNTYQSSASWGIVAPGGDPQSDTDEDDLHWIENIWTTTPYMSSPTDTSFEGECDNDYPSSTLSTVPDCRTLIAGTSMATPHVAGAAALILAVNPSYQSPSAMKQLLCSTADTLTVTTSTQGCGRLNVYRAMAKALSDPNLP